MKTKEAFNFYCFLIGQITIFQSQMRSLIPAQGNLSVGAAARLLLDLPPRPGVSPPATWGSHDPVRRDSRNSWGLHNVWGIALSRFYTRSFRSCALSFSLDGGRLRVRWAERRSEKRSRRSVKCLRRDTRWDRRRSHQRLHNARESERWASFGSRINLKRNIVRHPRGARVAARDNFISVLTGHLRSLVHLIAIQQGYLRAAGIPFGRVDLCTDCHFLGLGPLRRWWKKWRWRWRQGVTWQRGFLVFLYYFNYLFALSRKPRSLCPFFHCPCCDLRSRARTPFWIVRPGRKATTTSDFFTGRQTTSARANPAARTCVSNGLRQILRHDQRLVRRGDPRLVRRTDSRLVRQCCACAMCFHAHN